jgi:type I restriction enzyme, R subunit
MSVSRSEMNEAEIRNHFIDPSLDSAGWDMHHRRLEFTLNAGRIVNIDGAWNRGEGSTADYILMPRPDFYIGVVEAKDGSHAIGDGLGQALDYAGLLNVPFAASSNGEAYMFHDKTGLLFDGDIERVLRMDQFPSIETLLAAFYHWKGWEVDEQNTMTHPHYQDPSGGSKEPRYYQRLAIQAVIEDVTTESQRGLLVMATGAGKTYVASQIIHRLKSIGRVNRILFLADRNNLINQTLSGDFAIFGDVTTRIVNRTIDPSYEIYTCLYQSVSSSDEDLNVYRELSPDFFDMVIVDECHRGSARIDSAWREILEYFGEAYHLGLTATPREDSDVSTQSYFGEPLYEYSLGQGIDDGFLAPYIVHRIDLDVDVDGFRPGEGVLDMLGQEVEDRVYNRRDMERSMVLEERNELIASRIVDHLVQEGIYSKTIVFCVDTPHAARMRSAIINQLNRRNLTEIEHPLERIVVRITGNDEEGKAALDFFQNPRESTPVIATTSRLLNTGTDVPTCKLIVIDQEVRSQGLFRQMIGRGTRINELHGKMGFTIMDFRGATRHLLDPEWDGVPEIVFEGDRPITLRESSIQTPRPQARYYLQGEPVEILRDQVIHLNENGDRVTLSLTDYVRSSIFDRYGENLDDFLELWNSEKRTEVTELLNSSSFPINEVRDLIGNNELDDFDIITHLVYDRPPLTRNERANNVKKRDIFTRYGADARYILDILLDRYANTGELPTRSSLRTIANIGTPREIINLFGGLDEFENSIAAINTEIYI